MDPALAEFLLKMLEHGGSAALLGIVYIAWTTSKRLAGALDDLSEIRKALTNDSTGLPAIRKIVDDVARDVKLLNVPTIRHSHFDHYRKPL